jgi:hypothetical protein
MFPWLGPSNQAPHSTLQRDLTRTYYWGLQSAEDMMWRAKGEPILLKNLQCLFIY